MCVLGCGREIARRSGWGSALMRGRIINRKGAETQRTAKFVGTKI